MICARFFLLKFCSILNHSVSNFLKNYRTITDFYSDFWQSLKSVQVEKNNLFLEIKSETLFNITLAEI